MSRAVVLRRGAAVLVCVAGLSAVLAFASCSSTNAAPAPPPDASTPEVALAPCVVACDAAVQACADLDPEACNAACASKSVAGRADASVPRDVLACLGAAAADCAAVAACFAPPPLSPFSEGPYGTKPKDTAGPFTLTTTDGATWDFKKEWTGADSYVFLFYAPGEVVYPNGDYSDGLFKGSLSKDLLAKSVPDVHYFFMPLRSATGSLEPQGWAAARDRWAADVPAGWASRVHFVDTLATDQKNWIGDMMKTRISTALPYKQYDTMAFAIDRFQRIREVGMLGQLAANGITPKLGFLAFEPAYYDFEWNRDQAMRAAAPATEVALATTKIVHDTFDVDVTLPDAAKMATFDTLEADLTTDCDNHRDGECGAWDYLSHLWVCDPSTDPDGGAATFSCSTEIARWITSYWREGRWVTDISGMLPFLKGGATHFRWYASGQFDPRKTDYTVSLSLRMSNRQKGMRPVSATPLWSGGGWNAAYDAAHPARQVTVPAGAKKVDLYTLITGHGGSSNGNCAEFCNHEHHFTVNGKPHLRSFPGAQSPLGCTDEVAKGAIPNQHGTWYFGRGGWCPGYDVAPWIVDVTGEVKLGQSNDLGYTTTFGGKPVDVDRGNIVMSSYLVVWQ